MPQFSKSSYKHLMQCDRKLQVLLCELIKHYNFSIISSHRHKELQDKYFEEGRSKVKWPQSKHNCKPSKAVDLTPWPCKWDHNNDFLYFGGYVMGVAKMMGIKLRWGGDFNQNQRLHDSKFMDLVHFELVD